MWIEFLILAVLTASDTSGSAILAGDDCATGFACSKKVERNQNTNDCRNGNKGLIGNPNIRQNDPELISYIQKYHLTPPAHKPNSRINLFKNPSTYWREMNKIFNGKTNGFYIEAGTNNDGFRLSNTLQLEQAYNWTGLVIEPNSFRLPKLRLSNRSAWLAGVCLSLDGYPQKVRFLHRVTRKLRNGLVAKENSIYAGPVECFPLYSILLAVNRTVVDYFNLEIEGRVLDIIKIIPFDLVTIKVMSIEHDLQTEDLEVVESFLDSKGYSVIFKTNYELFAVHKDFVHEYQLG